MLLVENLEGRNQSFIINNLVAQLVPRVKVVGKKIEESHSMESFVDPICVSLFKQDTSYNPHCSNTNTSSNKQQKWSGDYVVTHENQQNTVLTGEGKGTNAQTIKVKKDKMKATVYTRRILDQDGFNYVLTFTNARNILQFYIMAQLYGDICPMARIEKFEPPILTSSLVDLVEKDLDRYLNLRYLSHSLALNPNYIRIKNFSIPEEPINDLHKTLDSKGNDRSDFSSHDSSLA